MRLNPAQHGEGPVRLNSMQGAEGRMGCVRPTPVGLPWKCMCVRGCVCECVCVGVCVCVCYV